jgi:hypothetical protein
MARIDFRVGGTSLVCMRAPKNLGGQNLYSTLEIPEDRSSSAIRIHPQPRRQRRQQGRPVKLGLPADFPRDQRHAMTFQARGDNKTEMTTTECRWTPGRMLELSKIDLGAMPR